MAQGMNQFKPLRSVDDVLAEIYAMFYRRGYEVEQAEQITTRADGRAETGPVGDTGTEANGNVSST